MFFHAILITTRDAISVMILLLLFKYLFSDSWPWIKNTKVSLNQSEEGMVNGRPQIIALVTVESLPKDSVDMSP